MLNNELEALARKILINNDMLKLPVNLSQIATNNNICVYEANLPEDISGSIRYNPEIKKFEILLNKKEDENGKRFTLAHELAHFFLYKEALIKSTDIICDTLYRKLNEEEVDVDYLASAILIDKELLTNFYKITNQVEVLANIFKVSVSTLTARLMVLNL